NTNNVNFNGSVTSSGGGVEITNAGTLNLAGKLTAAGAVLLDGAGGITLGADVETTAAGAAITVSDSPLTLTGDRLLETADGAIDLDEVSTGAGHILTVDAGSADALISGVVDGSGGLTKVGTGVLTLSAINIYTGDTTVNEGTLLVNGSTALGSAVAVNNTATLGGTGTVNGPVTVNDNGVISPGTSPGLFATGAITFAGSTSTTLLAEIDGTAVGTEYDQLGVVGTVDLDGTTLNAVVSGSFTPSQGDLFILIRNDGADAVVGTFDGLAEGDAFSPDFGGSGLTAHITYVGGDGNDVAIVVQGDVTYTSTPGVDDVYIVRRVGDSIQVLHGETEATAVVVDSRPLASFPSTATITFQGNNGENDTLIIQTTDFDNDFTATIDFHGGTGPSDVLRIEGGDTVASVVHDLDALGGTVTLDADGVGAGLPFVVLYDGLDEGGAVDPVTQTIAVTDLTLNYSGATETITFSDSGTPGQTTVDSDSATALTFANPTDRLTVNGGAGDDTIAFDGLGSGFDAELTVDGQTDSDSIGLNTDLVLAAGRNVDFTSEQINLNGNVTTSAGNIDLDGAVTLLSDVSLSTGLVAGDLIFTSELDGSHNLVLNIGGITRFQADVGSTTPLGDGTGAAITIDSTGPTDFEGTLEAASGIVQSVAAGEVTFRQNVTVAAGDTHSTFHENVTLDGM
ncbi:MAG: autotransporter-associated beta strand repeat-containing protein, partial [Planctomycetes bacterium]|nr:autotransporter-associated beta strand repeat-containing protein [Planctomycetota bacterium]